MSSIFGSQAFGIMLTMLFYVFGQWVYKKTKLPFFSPLIVATVLLILYVEISHITLSDLLTDLSGIHVFLGPLIVSLAIPIVGKMDLIKRNFVVIFVGSLVGALVSIFTVLVISPMLGIDETLVASLIPKASTTPIAIEISERLGGIRAITVAVVVLSAVIGAVVIPSLIKVLRIKDARIIGLSLGSTSHAIGTAKAFEFDQEAGAIASVSLVFTGVLTAIIAMFL